MLPFSGWWWLELAFWGLLLWGALLSCLRAVRSRQARSALSPRALSPACSESSSGRPALRTERAERNGHRCPFTPDLSQLPEGCPFLTVRRIAT